jgi:hypothetical protein
LPDQKPHFWKLESNSMLPPEITRLDTQPISSDKSEIRLFGVMKDERLRLPYFLDYYRRVGVKHFCIVDNDSRDGTTDYLLEQYDCSVFHTKGSYAQSRAGLTWLNPLIDQYGDGHWVILADADEILVYPGIEARALPELCQWLDRKGFQGVLTLLLDMYSDRPLQEINYVEGEDFLKACCWFDQSYYFVRRLGLPFFNPPCPSIEPIGGPRLRLCFPSQNTPRLWPRLRVKLLRRLSRLAFRLGLSMKVGGESVATQAFKIPLVKWRRGYAFVTSHRLNHIRLAPITGALLHFKYFQDFGARVRKAIESGMHYDGSSEYWRYGELLVKNPALSMAYEGSTRYRSTHDLVQLQLIQTDPDWEKLCNA